MQFGVHRYLQQFSEWGTSTSCPCNGQMVFGSHNKQAEAITGQ